MDAKYVSIDIETLGLDPEQHSLIELGAVIDDGVSKLEELPRYHAYVTHPVYHGDPYAMAMHTTLLKRIASREPGYNYIPFDMLAWSFGEWLKVQLGFKFDGPVKIQVAGKNYGMFDSQFLKRVPSWSEHIQTKHRVFDPSILYFDPKNDKDLPDLKKCLERAGVNKAVEHTAIADALDVISLLRFKFNQG